MSTKTLHFKAVNISRNKPAPDNAVAACAYRSGQDLYAEKEAKLHRYGNRAGVVETGIFAPAAAPEWLRDDDQGRAWQRLGNEIEVKEDSHNRRASALLAKDFQAAAPRELTREQNWALAGAFARKINERGLAVAVGFHEGDASDGGKNPHFHFLIPMREVTAEGFGKRYRSLDAPGKGKDNPELMALRREYFQCVNEALDGAGVEGVYYDPEKQEDKEPGVHLGKDAAALEKQGKETNAGRHNRKVKFRNHLRPYDKALEESEEPWAFTLPASEEKDWHKRFAEWQLIRGAAMASRDASQKSQSNVAEPAATRSQSRTEGARHGAMLAHRQSRTYQERVEQSRKDTGPDMSR